MKKPVLFLIFNRPETTFRVFEAIRAYQPEDLFIAADGPRPHVSTDAVRCAEVRTVAEKVDWRCRVHTLFREKNMGCRYGVADGITWFFDQVEEGIILEDDCLPSPDFFRFCEEMLVRYRDNEKVMHIGGTNFQDGIKRGDGSYYFSMIPHIWGWASWRRAWKKYDVNMTDFPEYIKNWKPSDFMPGHPYIQWRFQLLFRKTYEKSPYFNTWDYQWHYAVVKNKGLTVIPNYNLVSNIGESGTHTVASTLCHLPCQRLPERILPPADINMNSEADLYSFNKIYKGTWKDYTKYFLFKLHILQYIWD